MKLQVYVGNYPNRFRNEDLLNLFQDFEGIKLHYTKTNHNKCFAFFQCVDEDQVIDVVTTMNGIDVCSRNLVVRATDEELQHLIEEYLQEDKLPKNRNREINSYHSPHFISKKTYRPDNIDDLPSCVRFRNPLLDKGMERDSFDKKRYYRQPHASRIQSPTQSECESRSIMSLQNLSLTEVSDSNVDSQNLSKASPKHDGKVKNFPDAEVNLPMNAKFEDCPTGRINSYQGNSAIGMPELTYGISVRKSVKADASSGINSCDERVVQKYEVMKYPEPEEPMYYVSVANFPFNTTVAQLYELFQDIKPDNIVMICNFPNRGKVTEAFLCFKSKDQAVDTIMDHDNTLYYGRYLVVSDACVTDPCSPPHFHVKK